MRAGRFEPVVLCYHAISDDWNHSLSVPKARLERQLKSLLRRRFRPATIDVAVAGAGRIFHVTFDDAFRSVLDAIPTLSRLGVPATIFVCPDLANDGRAFPLDDPGVRRTMSAETLATLPWHDLKELAAGGVTIGSHTMTHPHLTEISDAALFRELSDSRRAVEEMIGKPCRYLAYPFGGHDARVRAAARTAGYAAAFGLPGRDRPIDTFALPRIGIWNGEGLFRIALKTSTVRPSSPLVQRVLRRTDQVAPAGRSVATGDG